MVAATADRRHVRSVETAIEIQATLLDQAEIDRREDGARKRAQTFAHGILDALSAQEALDRLDDAKREQALSLARELAGVLDGVDAQAAAK